LTASTPVDIAHLGLASAPIGVVDAARIARKAMGLDPNP
jgi:hypothetical protein